MVAVTSLIFRRQASTRHGLDGVDYSVDVKNAESGDVAASIAVSRSQADTKDVRATS